MAKISTTRGGLQGLDGRSKGPRLVDRRQASQVVEANTGKVSHVPSRASA